MNFKDRVRFYLTENTKRVEDFVLEKGVKTDDVIPGWSKISNPSQWGRITEKEFINYVNIYMADNQKKGKKRGDKNLQDNFTPEDFKGAYLKLMAIIMDEKKLKRGKPVSFSDMKGDLDKNPGNPENMLVSIFFDLAAEEAKKGVTSASFREGLRANAPAGSKVNVDYYNKGLTKK